MKKLFAIMMALVMVFCLAGCGVNIASVSLPDSLDLNAGESVGAAVTFAANQDCGAAFAAPIFIPDA